ncbi:hypothetical protein [Nesterenkonia sp. CF4.4]|uniref:hypothetical protein n=1 Tax=Nesterenkonia sp. CF4.4 TaxID=3373079 RepID=UPI003EE665A2
MTRSEFLGIRITLGTLAFGALIAQLIVVPRTAAGLAEKYPQVAHLESPYLVAVTVALVGFEAALLAGWMLVTGTCAESASVGRVRWWANGMTASLGVTALVLAGVFLHAGWVENVGGPPMLFGLVACLAVLPVALMLRRWALRSVSWRVERPSCVQRSRNGL